MILRHARAIASSLLLACSGPDRQPDATADPAINVVPILTLADTADVVIGASEIAETEQLFQVSSAFLLSDGTMVVANAGTRELRFYNNAGRLLRAVGRDGAGPGEFRYLRSAARLRGDSVVAWDPPQRRLTYFDAQGAVVATQALGGVIEIELSGRSVVGFPSHAWFLADGRGVFELGFPTAVMSRGPNGVRRDTLPLVVMRRDGSVEARIGPIAGAETLVHDGSSMPLPLGYRLLVAAGGAEIYAGDGKSPIEVFDPTGRRIRAIEIEPRPTVISDSDFAAVKERILGNTVSSIRASVHNMLETMARPAFRPSYARLLAAHGDRLWVQRYPMPADSVQRWLVLEPHGEPASEVRLPAAYELLDASIDHVLVLLRDQLGTEQLRLYALHSGA
jgi:hypothetical protein